MSDLLRVRLHKQTETIRKLEEDNHQLRATITLKDKRIQRSDVTDALQRAEKLIVDELLEFVEQIAASKSKFARRAATLLGR